MLKPLDLQILRLAVPNIIANVTVPLLGMVDMAITAHVAGQTGIAAVALAGQVFNFVYWNCGFVRMTQSGLVAQALGRDNKEQCGCFLMRGTLLAVAVAALILMFRTPIINLASSLASDTSGDAMYVAREYFQIRVWAAPAVLLGFCAQGWMIGMQDSRYPMLVAVVANVLNVAATCLFCFRWQMGVQGVAWGTLVAQYAALALWVAGTARKVLKQKVRLCFWTHGEVTSTNISFYRYLVKNGDIFLRTLMIAGVSLSFTFLSARFGELTLAANSMLMQLFMLFSYACDGFAFAAEALVGKCTGRIQREKASTESVAEIRATIRRLCHHTEVVTVLYTLAYALCWRQILTFMGADATILGKASESVWFVVAINAVSVVPFLFDGIFLGKGRTRDMMLTVWLAGLLSTVALALSFGALGESALWLFYGTFIVLRGAGLVWIFCKSRV